MSEVNVVLGGRYRLGKILGTGGMAEVFLAEDTRLHRTVAVKVLRSDLARDANFQERFRREAHSAASLNHPSIVAVYDTGEEQQTTITGAEVTIPYIVMEYVHGDTLREHIKPEQPMDAHQAGEIMAALLSALEYSHRAGIVHRDIKPGNIMINEAGAVKVMDFGIARAIADATSAMTATQAVMGTAQYLSPEQARGQLVDARSDIYSAACVMFEMMTGRPPFTGDTPVSIAYQHVREEPLAPSAYNPVITPALDAVILTGLAKDREERYPSAVAFSRDIATVVAGRTPALVGGAVPRGGDGEVTTVLSPLDDATEALPAIGAARLGAAGLGAAGAGAAGVGATATMQAQNWSSGSAPSPATAPLALRTADEVEEQEDHKKPWWLIILVIVAVLALVGAAIAIFDPFGERGPELVAVPGVVGQTEEDASTILREVGLEPEFTQVESQDVEAGLVIETTPAEGEEVEAGATVAVTVSAGPEPVQVPDGLEGMTRDAAREALEAVGLTMTEGETEDVPQEQGTVSSTRPLSGATVERGSAVEVRLASGNVEMPDVEGTQFDRAKETLEARGFVVPEPSEREDAEADPGTVLSQTPAAGSGLVPYGSSVDLVIAAAPGPVTVPNVAGRTLAEAQATLAEAGFGTEPATEFSATVPEGQVIRTEPGANEQAARGAQIKVVVSSGPEPTPDPTTPPTEEPTEEPTEAPSEAPSTTPTEEPTEDPGDDSAQGNNGNGQGNGGGNGNGNGKGNSNGNG
ncbi:Stk1 family PASTA domain-containing Ser/Thr kinase [uncultured Brachybacterium sp.]|uniref:Stk1 family PASTA domain-containing Ser/Thr kinase n=1 Tax=uncultured Brachybacterium sp. TaxID=189680 RepID=UPI002611221C|nr:Stk1 family PASTA domain-containing Ser/Thr kinase [uncultured Brachybacterium sp.]